MNSTETGANWSRIGREFFMRDPVTCARELIGCSLTWNECSGVIVETEAYSAVNDEASHTWTRPSARSFVERNEAGAAYVYFNYGMYWMLNVLVKGGAADGFVLFRALEPTAGIAAMEKRRLANRRVNGKTNDRTNGDLSWLCSGPGKLAQALGVNGSDHGRDFCSDPAIGFYREIGGRGFMDVGAGVRIGISRAQELEWRFLAIGSVHVSVGGSGTKGKRNSRNRAVRE